MDSIEWISKRYNIKKNIRNLLMLILQGTVCDYNKNHDKLGRFAKGNGGTQKRTYEENGETIEIASESEGKRVVTGQGKEVQRVYDDIVEQEKGVTNNIIEASEKAGAKLAGLKFCIKTGDSVGGKIDRKLLEHGIEPSKATVRQKQMIIKGMTDILRYTTITGHDKIVETTEKVIKSMEKNGNELVELSNKWLENGKPFRAAYHGVHLLFRNKQGTVFEMQVHSPDTFDIKMNKTHKDYELFRGDEATREEKAAAFERMAKIWDKVPLPKGIEKLKDFSNL